MPSPVTLADFERMKASVLWSDEDVKSLRRSHEILAPRVEKISDVWLGFARARPHLLAARDGRPLADHLGAVRQRLARWILDTARAEYGQAWLDDQHQLGLDLHTPPVVPFRDLFLLAFPVTYTLKPFLAQGGSTPAEVDAMHAAWLKSCLLQLTLWSHPYIKDGDF